MKDYLKRLIALALVVLLGACSTEDDLIEEWIETNEVEIPPTTGTSGSADLSDLVVLGTSLGAGFMDGSLYTEGQAASFPAFLGTQFQISGIGGTTDFGQPDINSANGYNFILNDGTSGRTELSLSLQVPVATTGDITSLLTSFGGTTSTLNNFSIPVAQAVQLVAAATGGPVTKTFDPVGGVDPSLNPAYNPYYRRFASSPSPDGTAGSSPMTDALSANGTFFIYEAGINDVGLYAAGGGTDELGPLTDAVAFEGFIDIAINALASAGTSLVTTPTYSVEGVVLNIPSILAFPFFRAVTYNAVELDAATAATLNESLSSVIGAIESAPLVGGPSDVSDRLFSYSEGNNPILIWDETLDDLTPAFTIIVTQQVNEDPEIIAIPDGPQKDAIIAQAIEDGVTQLAPYAKARPLVEGELVVLTAGAVLGTEADGDDSVADSPIGAAVPLGFNSDDPAESSSDEFILNFAEQQEIEVARASFNAALAGAVADVNAAGGDIILVDIESLLLSAINGIDVDGITLDPDFAPNGIFSTDGIHPNGRGHAIVANTIIQAINATWDASIPEIDVINIRGVYITE